MGMLDEITKGVVAAGGKGQFKGGCGASLGFALISVTSAVPEIFEIYVQAACLLLIAIGMLKIAFHTIW